VVCRSEIPEKKGSHFRYTGRPHHRTAVLSSLRAVCSPPPLTHVSGSEHTGESRDIPEVHKLFCCLVPPHGSKFPPVGCCCRCSSQPDERLMIMTTPDKFILGFSGDASISSLGQNLMSTSVFRVHTCSWAAVVYILVINFVGTAFWRIEDSGESVGYHHFHGM